MEGILGSPKLLILLTQKAPWERSFIFRNKNCVPDFFQAILNVSSPQAGEGRAQRENDRRKERGIWGGALEENRGPHLTAVLLTDGSQVCIVYRRSTRSRSLRRPRISFPPPLPHPSHLPAGHGEKFCRTERTFSSALVSAGWRAQRENDRSKERGIWGGALEENRGPHLTAVLLTDGSQVCIVYRRSTRSRSLRRPRISFPPPLPHPSHLPAGPREKFCRTQAHVQLGTRLRRMAGPKGRRSNDGAGVMGGALEENR